MTKLSSMTGLAPGTGVGVPVGGGGGAPYGDACAYWPAGADG